MKNKLMFIQALFFCSMILTLNGCAVLNPGPPMAQVILPIRMPVAKEIKRMPVQVLVAQPVTDAATGTDRILALMAGYEIRALGEAKWASPVPWMVQRLLIDTLEASQRLEGVGWEESMSDADVRLATDIRRFYLVYDQPGEPPVADLAFTFSLVDLKTGKTFARTVIAAKQPCAGNSLHEFVAAYSLGMTKVLDQSNEWILRKTEEQYRPRPSAGNGKGEPDGSGQPRF